MPSWCTLLKTELCAEYELRQGKVVKCRGTVPLLGYSPDTLRQMYKDGYRLYENGKLVKVSAL